MKPKTDDKYITTQDLAKELEVDVDSLYRIVKYSLVERVTYGLFKKTDIPKLQKFKNRMREEGRLDKRKRGGRR